MTDRENQTSEEDSQSSAGNSDLILLIALSAFIVIVAVAVLLIIFDTRGLFYYSDRIRMYPHPGFLWKALVKLSFWRPSGSFSS